MKLIENAWQSYKAAVVPADAGADQIRDTRLAFFSGASILFASLTSTDLLEGIGTDDIDPTDADLAVMDDIQAEVDQFGAELDLAAGVTRQ
jgi:hypothetical protein